MRIWFQMKKDGAKVSIHIYDEIGKSWWGEETVTAKSFVDELKALGDVSEVDLHINSPGGDVFDGITIHNAINNHKAKFTGYVDGIAASAASYILMACDKIVMPANAFLLIHEASGFAMGTADDMMGTAADLERINTSLIATYANRSKQTTAKVAKIMAEDRLMDATEAKDLGFTDEVAAEKKMAARFSNNALRLLPKAAAETIKKSFTATSSDEPAAPSAPDDGDAGADGDKKPPAPAPSSPEIIPPEQAPAEPEPSRNDPPKPTTDSPAPAAKVVNLDDARKEGRAAYAKYVAEVNDLCVLAGVNAKMAADFIAKDVPIETVRAELVKARANPGAGGGNDVIGAHAIIPPAKVEASWSKITDRINKETEAQMSMASGIRS